MKYLLTILLFGLSLTSFSQPMYQFGNSKEEVKKFIRETMLGPVISEINMDDDRLIIESEWDNCSIYYLIDSSNKCILYMFVPKSESKLKEYKKYYSDNYFESDKNVWYRYEGDKTFKIELSFNESIGKFMFVIIQQK